MIDDYAIHDAKQPAPKPVRVYAAPTLEDINGWIALTPNVRDKALLGILLLIVRIAENTAAKRGIAEE